MKLELGNAEVVRFRDDFARLDLAIRRVIVGQEDVISELLITVLAGGHVLLEGLPGLGKTQLAIAMAKSIGVSFSRIQCTPDLMPSDITGSEVLVEGKNGYRQGFRFQPGPIFASMVLVDEINRAPPKTQSAMLEAMQERQVTYAGVKHELPSPFWILATLNRIEFEGTYPLPEAQLDRFFSHIVVPYPSTEALLALVDCALDTDGAKNLDVVLSSKRIAEMMAQAREVVLSYYVKRAAVNLIVSTHPGKEEGSSIAKQHVLYGASPRALQSLLRAARVRALVEGRGHVAIDDLLASALPVLRHRVFLTMASQLDGMDTDAVLGELVSEWFKKQAKMLS